MKVMLRRTNIKRIISQREEICNHDFVTPAPFHEAKPRPAKAQSDAASHKTLN
jgi:hypothetical protein